MWNRTTWVHPVYFVNLPRVFRSSFFRENEVIKLVSDSTNNNESCSFGPLFKGQCFENENVNKDKPVKKGKPRHSTLSTRNTIIIWPKVLKPQFDKLMRSIVLKDTYLLPRCEWEYRDCGVTNVHFRELLQTRKKW